MAKRDYYIRSCVREVEEDGIGIQMVSIDSEAEAVDHRPASFCAKDGRRYGGRIIGKITFELYDERMDFTRIKKEALSKLLSLLHTCLASEFDDHFYNKEVKDD